MVICVCVALWWTGNLPVVYPASCLMMTGTGSSPLWAGWSGSGKWIFIPILTSTTIRTIWVQRNMACKGAELTLFWGFADLHLSALWLPPLISGKVDRISTRVAPSVLIFSLPKWQEQSFKFLLRFSTSTFFQKSQMQRQWVVSTGAAT